MEKVERLRTRLANIRTVQPILEALRTISVGSWRMAVRQQRWIMEYGDRLGEIWSALAPHLAASQGAGAPAAPRPQRLVLLVVGSERGLCGRFNAALVEATAGYLATQAEAGCQVELWAAGARLVRLIRRRAWALTWSASLSVTALPCCALAWELTHRCLEAYEGQQLDAVDMLYNAYRRPGVYVPTLRRLLPPALPTAAAEPAWPPPIVDTDPQGILRRLLEQRLALALYGALIESAAAEHSARFGLMEAATQNAERLITELTQQVQSARKHTITREMQELAVGAGLLNPPTAEL